MRTLLLIFILFLCFDISAQKSLDVKVLNPPKIIKPGEPFTLFIEAKCEKGFNDKIKMELLLPNSFQLLMAKKPITVEAEKVIRYIFTINSKFFLKYGFYNLGIKTYGDGFENDIENLSVEVGRFRKLDILSINTPEYLKEGDTLKTEFIIQNLGNSTEKVTLKSLQGKIEFPKNVNDTIKTETINLKRKVKSKVVKDESKNDTLLLEPNTSAKIYVTKVVPVIHQSSWDLTANLNVFMTDSLKPITKNILIPVYSNSVKKTDPYLRFPIEIGGGYNTFKSGETQLLGFQYDIRGKGELDFSKKHYLDFTFHGPNQFNLPAIGTYDIYAVEYNYNKKINILAGDYTLKIDNLLEVGRFGRGFKFDHSFKKVEYSFFYNNPRFFSSQKNTYGGTFTINPSKKYSLTLNYIRKKNIDINTSSDVELVGLTNKINLRNFTLENEIAKSYQFGKNGFGLFNRVDWQARKLRISSNFIYTEKDFQGFYNNSYYLFNNLSYRFSKKINITLNSNISRLNPNFDQNTFVISPYSQSYTLGSNYQLSPFKTLFVGYENREREDRSSRKTFYFKEEYGRIVYSVNSPTYTLYSEVRLGVSKNLLVKTDSSANQKFSQLALQPQLKLFPWLWIGGLFNYQHTSSYSNDNKIRNFFYYGGSTRLTLSKFFTANLNYRNNFAPDELIEKQSFFDINANLKLGNHEISFSGGKSYIPIINAVNQNIEFYSIKYKLRLNTPIARNKKLSSIKGQILGLSDNINTKGMIIELGGRKYMTGANGLFQFDDLAPDRYFLNIARSSMGVGIHSTFKSPMELIVKADTTYNVKIPLIKTGNILGKINFKKSESIGIIDITKHKPLVFVKLFNEKENYLTQVNEKDEFSFKEIRPGKWKIFASTPGKDDQFTILNIDDVIELNPEESRTTTVTIVAKERKVNFSTKTRQISNKTGK